MRSEREDSLQSAFIRKSGELMPVEAEAKTMPGEGTNTVSCCCAT